MPEHIISPGIANSLWKALKNTCFWNKGLLLLLFCRETVTNTDWKEIGNIQKHMISESSSWS